MNESTCCTRAVQERKRKGGQAWMTTFYFLDHCGTCVMENFQNSWSLDCFKIQSRLKKNSCKKPFQIPRLSALRDYSSPHFLGNRQLRMSKEVVQKLIFYKRAVLVHTSSVCKCMTIGHLQTFFDRMFIDWDALSCKLPLHLLEENVFRRKATLRDKCESPFRKKRPFEMREKKTAWNIY